MIGTTAPPFTFFDEAQKNLVNGIFFHCFQVYVKKLGIPSLKFKHTKSLSKVVRTLRNGQADIAMSALSIRSKRAKDADFPYPMDVRKTKIWFVWPKPVKSLGSLVKCFDDNFWIAIAATVLCMGFILQMSDFNVGDYVKSGNYEGYHGLFPNVTLAYVTMIFEAQPIQWFNSKSIARGMLVSVWLLMGYILGQSYRANLKASLVAIDYEKPINSATDLIKYKIPLGVAKDSSTYGILAETKSPLLKEVFEKNVIGMPWAQYDHKNHKPKNLAELAQAGLIATSTSGEKFIFEGKNSIYRQSDAIIKWNYKGNFVSRNSPLRSKLDVINMYVVQAGLFQHWNDMVVMTLGTPKPDPIRPNVANRDQRLSLRRMTLTFCIIPIGLVFAFFCFLLELAFGKVGNRKPGQKIKK